MHVHHLMIGTIKQQLICVNGPPQIYRYRQNFHITSLANAFGGRQFTHSTPCTQVQSSNVYVYMHVWTSYQSKAGQDTGLLCQMPFRKQEMFHSAAILAFPFQRHSHKWASAWWISPNEYIRGDHKYTSHVSEVSGCDIPFAFLCACQFRGLMSRAALDCRRERDGEERKELSRNILAAMCSNKNGTVQGPKIPEGQFNQFEHIPYWQWNLAALKLQGGI